MTSWIFFLRWKEYFKIIKDKRKYTGWAFLLWKKLLSASGCQGRKFKPGPQSIDTLTVKFAFCYTHEVYMKQMNFVFCLHYHPLKISLYVCVNVNTAKSEGKLKLQTYMDLSTWTKGLQSAWCVLHHSLDRQRRGKTSMKFKRRRDQHKLVSGSYVDILKIQWWNLEESLNLTKKRNPAWGER